MGDEHVVRFGAPTLAGIKTGSLFTSPYEDRRELLTAVRAVDRTLAPRGVRLRLLRFTEKRGLLYLYRPALLERDLSRREVRGLLMELGYRDLRPGRCLRELMRRLRRERDFPHEIGLFLSYPAEDVAAFIRTGGVGCKCVGCWKVYGNVDRAQAQFKAYEKCTESYCRRCARGVPLSSLAVDL